MNENLRSGYVAIIGRPNVGKSTLMNHILNMKLAITSRKPQTTRKKIMTVYTEDRGQIVFLDTPGIHKAKNALGEYMDKVAYGTISDADAVLWLVEPDVFIGEGEKKIVEYLIKSGAPVILAINKTDTVKDKEIPKIKEAYAGIYDFKYIIPISAKHSTGKDELLSALFSLMPYGEPFYDEDTVTDETERDIVAELIREQLLRNLSDEVPHGTAVEIDSMKEKPRGYFIDATIYCEKSSHKGMIIGKEGHVLKKIGTEARLQAEKLLDKKVTLKLWVKVKKDWRNDEKGIRAFGYRE